jgi:hypothetical protein
MTSDGVPRLMGGVEPTLSFVEARSNSLSEALEVLRGVDGPILEADSFEGSFGVKECDRT